MNQISPRTLRSCKSIIRVYVAYLLALAGPAAAAAPGDGPRVMLCDVEELECLDACLHNRLRDMEKV